MTKIYLYVIKVFNTIMEMLADNSGMSEIIGVAFLIIFIVFILGKPLQSIGNTLGTGYNNLNDKINNSMNYLNQIN
ncbi:hypothetical protein ACAG39_01960 [Caldicellulosiruptoraceae bacterium PP1]